MGRDAKAANLCKATVPFPHLKTPPETPLVGKDAVNIILYHENVKLAVCVHKHGIALFDEFYRVARAGSAAGQERHFNDGLLAA